MISTSRLVFGLLILGAAYVGKSAACVCIALADESKICSSDYVIKVKILKKVSTDLGRNSTDHGGIDYTVSVLDVLRSDIGQIPTNTTITTEAHNCGVHNLEVGDIYFIAGNVRDGSYQIHRCSSVIAQYLPFNDAPLRDIHVKVDVDPKCPHSEDGIYEGESENVTGDAWTVLPSAVLVVTAVIGAGIVQLC